MKNLFLIAAKAIKLVYEGFCVDVRSTEYSLTFATYKGKPLQILAIGGTNELLDWAWNLAVLSWDGVKLCSWLSARRIKKAVKINPNMPLLVTGHSKSGPTALYWKKRYGAKYCVAFCPARGFRRAEKMENTYIIIDPDDPVPKLGAISFRHPDCEVVKLPDDHDGFKISDHFIDHVIDGLKLMAV